MLEKYRVWLLFRNDRDVVGEERGNKFDKAALVKFQNISDKIDVVNEEFAPMEREFIDRTAPSICTRAAECTERKRMKKMIAEVERSIGMSVGPALEAAEFRRCYSGTTNIGDFVKLGYWAQLAKVRCYSYDDHEEEG